MKNQLVIFLAAIAAFACGATGWVGGPAMETAVLESRYEAKDPGLTADPRSEFWGGLPGVTLDRHIVTGEPMPHLRAEVRSRWTRNHLYFLFVGTYETIRTKPDTDLTAETYRLWMWDCFEAYVDWVDGPPHRYREFQMSPRGEWLDLDIDSTRERIGAGDERYWDSGMAVKARIDGGNKVWVGEMRIPWTAIMSRTPGEGDEIPVNFYRQDGEPGGGQGPGGGRTFMAWQPTGKWNPHFPDKFGTLRLIFPPTRASQSD